MNSEKKLRSRPAYYDVLSDADDEQDDGSLKVHGLPEDVHAHFAINEPKNIEKLRRQGYEPADSVSTAIGDSEGGEFKHPVTGEDVKVMICLKSRRARRLEKFEQKNQRLNEQLYADDLADGREMPISGVRSNPPSGYDVGS